jgi:hypothetical protein
VLRLLEDHVFIDRVGGWVGDKKVKGLTSRRRHVDLACGWWGWGWDAPHAAHGAP